MINYNQLYYFYVVARAGSVTEGAKELQVAQPSVSAQIKTLESKIGRKLFERVGRRVRLSSQGEVIYGHCRRIFEAAEALEREIERGEHSESRLHIGVSTDIERPFLVEMISRISEIEGGISRIKMSSDSKDRLSSLLRTDALDAAITSEPIFEIDFSILSSAKMPVVLAFNQNGKFKKLSAATTANFRTLSRDLKVVWAMPQKNMRLRKETDAFFERHRFNPDIVFESDVLATVVRAVADDVGVAFLPKPYLRTYTPLETVRSVGPSEGFWQHGIWLLGRKQRQNSKELSLLKSVFQKVVGDQHLKLAGRSGP
jgi:LysR family transcriptional activator of nhaA